MLEINTTYIVKNKMNKLFKFFKRNNNSCQWDYDFFYNLEESDYPKYLAVIFKQKTGKKLNLKHPKTFNEKLQWIKLYGVTPLMRDCTDKVKVRNYVKEKIGEEYLKPVLQIIPNNTSVIANHDSILGGEAIRRNLRKGETRVNEGIAYDSDSEVCDLPERQQIQRQEEVKQETGNENSGIKPEFQNVDCRGTQNVVVPRNDRSLVFIDNDNKNNDVTTYFDQIDFDKLPDSFVIKTNHGCKWQYIIKNKNEFLKNKRLFELVKKNMTSWLEQDYSFWGGFEMQYHAIEPKILIEPLMRDDINIICPKIEVFCFNGMPKYILKLFYSNKIAIYDEKLNITNDFLGVKEEKVCVKADDLIKQAFQLSCILAENFDFTRVDWMIYQNRIWFEEYTFTPHSGFYPIKEDYKLGKLLNIRKGEI